MQYANIAAEIYNQPLLITPEKLHAVMAVLRGKLRTNAGSSPSLDQIIEDMVQLGFSRESAMSALQGKARDARSAKTTNIAVIPIVGSLVHRNRGFSSGSGLRSYQSIGNDLKEALANQDIGGIMLDVDSHGGEAAGCFDLADKIRNARQVKPIYAHVNQSAYSAAYGIISAAEKIFVSRTSGLGSIGVIMQHVDQSKRNKKTGLKIDYIFSGKHKADGHPHGPLPVDVRAKMQERVDSLRTIFTEAVDSNRDLKTGTALATEAGYYIGAEGITAGLADAEATWEEALAELSAVISKPSARGKDKMNTQERLSTLIDNNDDASAALSALGFVSKTTAESEVAGKIKEQLAAARKEGAEQATSRAMGIVDLCAMAGMQHMAKPLIEKGSSLEEAGKDLLAEKAAVDGNTPIQSTLGDKLTPEGNGFLDYCKSLA